MSLDLVLGGFTAAAILIYLIIALLRAERF
jgi:K+-transporting ATPase KdpF subunit